MTASRRWTGLVLWVLLCFGVAAVASRFEPGAWYAALEKPSWTPPNAVFAPVWTVLYAAMGVAAWRVWARGRAAAPLALFLVQLGLNGLWSYFFFGLRQPGLALVDIGLLWVALAATIGVFYRRDRVAAGLLAPYLAWVSYATALNYAIWQLNG